MKLADILKTVSVFSSNMLSNLGSSIWIYNEQNATDFCPHLKPNHFARKNLFFPREASGEGAWTAAELGLATREKMSKL